MLGINAIVVGSITQFGLEDKSTKVGGIGGGFGRLAGGAFGKKKGKANVAIDARLVNVDTGEIVAVASGKGTSKRGMLLGGVGAGGGGYGAGGVEMGSSNFQDTILGEAVRAAVEDLTAQLSRRRGRLRRQLSLSMAWSRMQPGARSFLMSVRGSGVAVGMKL